MKTIGKIILSLLILTLGTNLSAQNKQANAAKTVSISVAGNCESCKVRIEKAVQLKGVSKATWNEKTKKLTLTYNPSVVSLSVIQKKIAAAGHDNGNYKAPKAVYDQLPACCKYR